jgi:hypothetical protein
MRGAIGYNITPLSFMKLVAYLLLNLLSYSIYVGLIPKKVESVI